MIKRIFNKYEKITYEKIEEICTSSGASVFPKVRLADVFNISQSGLTNEEYSFALKSHFDFIVCDDLSSLPNFAVEFDGDLHQTEVQKKRDEIKNRLAEKFKLPLLRINSLYLEKKYRDLDLLSWCIEIWYTAEAFYKAQKEGLVPYDESFSPESIYSITNNEKKFPFLLSYDIRKEILKLCNINKLRSFSPNVWIGTDKEENYYGICWIWIDEQTGIFTNSGIKAKQFPISESELLEDLMMFELYEKLLKYFDRSIEPTSYSQIATKVNEFESKYKLALMQTGGIREAWPII